MASLVIPRCSSRRTDGDRDPSDAMAMNKCSVLTYSSFKRSASDSAESVTVRKRADRPGCEPPCARGSLSSSVRTAVAIAAGSTFIFRTISGTIPSRCSLSVSSTCSGRISGFPSRSASCCAARIASCAFSVYLLMFISVASCQSPVSSFQLLLIRLRQLLVKRALLLGQRAGELDLHRRVQIAAIVRLANRGHAMALQSEHLAALRGLRNLEPDGPGNGWHLGLAAKHGGRDRHSHVGVQVHPLAFEDRVRPNTNPQIQIA